MTITESVLLTLSNSDDYRAFRKALKNGMLPKESMDLIKLLGDYYAAEGCSEIDWKGFHNWIQLRHSNHGSIGEFNAILGHFIESGNCNGDANDSVYQLLLDRARAVELSEIALDIAEGGSTSWDAVKDALERYISDSKALSRAMSRTVAGTEENLLETLTSVKSNTGMKWCLPTLDRMLGRLSSELVFVAARPDGGKTTFLAHNAWNWASQTPEGKCVLWFNNEESMTKVQRRVWCSALGKHESEILEDINGSNLEYRKIVPNGRIVYIDDADDVSVVEAALNKYSPSVIIMDQLYKIRGMETKSKEGNDAERFRALCNWARDIAKHVAPVVATNQLDGSAEGVMYPTMSMLYGSKTGAQGEADIILTIGRIPSENDKRFIHTPKNKVTSSDEQSIVILDRFRARYYDYAAGNGY
jgi:replicative DNA helicase